jgi:hypothetical protein
MKRYFLPLGILLWSLTLTAQVTQREWEYTCAKTITALQTPGTVPQLIVGLYHKGEVWWYGFNTENSDSIYFKTGGLLYLTQAYAALLEDKKSPGFLKSDINLSKDVSRLGEIASGISWHQLLTHTSGFPRYPWNLNSPEDIWQFCIQFKPPSKPEFQISMTGCSLLETYFRSKDENYPASILKLWGIENGFSTSFQHIQLAKSVQNNHFLPENKWSFHLFQDTSKLYFTPSGLMKIVQFFTESKDSMVLKMMQIHENTVVKHLKMGYGFQVATNIKSLPIAMLNSTDQGNSLFLGIVPKTQTGIFVLGYSDEKVDKFGLALMSIFHRDMLKLEP